MMHNRGRGVNQIHRRQNGRTTANPSAASVWGQLGSNYDIEQASLFANLFCPAFVGVQGCVLLEAKFETSAFHRWWQELHGDIAAIERMVNHTHLYDLFPRADDEELALLRYEHVAQSLIGCWEGALRRAFPDRSFAFSYATEPDEYGPTITFWQVR